MSEHKHRGCRLGICMDCGKQMEKEGKMIQWKCPYCKINKAVGCDDPKKEAEIMQEEILRHLKEGHGEEDHVDN